MKRGVEIGPLFGLDDKKPVKFAVFDIEWSHKYLFRRRPFCFRDADGLHPWHIFIVA